MTRAQQVYESLQGLVAFTLPKDARKLNKNQYGTRYTFPDGSRLLIDTKGNRIKWWNQSPNATEYGQRQLFK